MKKQGHLWVSSLIQYWNMHSHKHKVKQQPTGLMTSGIIQDDNLEQRAYHKTLEIEIGQVVEEELRAQNCAADAPPGFEPEIIAQVYTPEITRPNLHIQNSESTPPVGSKLQKASRHVQKSQPEVISTILTSVGIY